MALTALRRHNLESPVEVTDVERFREQPETAQPGVTLVTAARSHARIPVGPVMLDTVTYEEAVNWAVACITAKTEVGMPARIVTINAQLVHLAHQSERFARIISGSDLVVADGLPLVWAARFLGRAVGGQIRGVDLMESICSSGGPVGLTVYILGGLPRAAGIAGERLAARYKGLRIVGTDCPPVGFESDPALNEAVVQRIISARPDLLVVALGAPKEEHWTEDNYRRLPARVIIPVGAAVDTIAGLRSRPPVWMRKIGLEWFGRLLLEPRRLWRRYLIGNSIFIYLVFRQRIIQIVQRMRMGWEGDGESFPVPQAARSQALEDALASSVTATKSSDGRAGVEGAL